MNNLLENSAQTTEISVISVLILATGHQLLKNSSAKLMAKRKNFRIIKYVKEIENNRG